jgi:hypothetical protein
VKIGDLIKDNEGNLGYITSMEVKPFHTNVYVFVFFYGEEQIYNSSSLRVVPPEKFNESR